MAYVRDLWHASRKNSDGETVRIRTPRYAAGKRWQACWLNPEGREQSKAFAKKEEAKDYANAMDSDVNRGDYIDPKAGTILFGKIAERWRSSLVVDPSSYIVYESILRLHVLPIFERRPINAIKPSSVQKFISSLAGTHSLSLVTNAHHITLAIFDLAVADEIIRKNPSRSEVVKLPKPLNEKIVPWPDLVFYGVLDAHPDEYKLVPILAAGCGLRQGEIFGVSEEDFDFEEKVLHVRRQVKKLGSEYVFALPKNDRERVVPLPEWVIAAAKQHIQAYKPRPYSLPWEKVTGQPRTHRILFRWRTDDRHLRARLYNELIWRPALVAAGRAPEPAKDKRGRRRYVNDRRDGMHALRHLYASVLLANGVSIKDLAEFLGHADPAFTLRTYIHMLPGSHARAIEAIDGRLFRARQESHRTETEQPHLAVTEAA